MARLTHDAQSFLLDNRRIWLVGASIEYTRVPAELWADRIAAARQAGFNTIVSACPWLVHEPRKGRYTFTDQSDVARFVTLCRDAGLYVGLRVGPYVGDGYDGGGLPSWLREIHDIRLRDANPAYLERVALYLRKLLAQVADLQVRKVGGGGVIFVQAEQSWRCSNDQVAEGYLGEISRHIRENGITVPILTANDLWAEERRAIETWQGWDRLLPNLRQLRVINPDHPRIVSRFEVVQPVVWGDRCEGERPSGLVLRNFAQTLAAGGQAILSPFHGGTSFGFLGGRLPARPDGFTTTSCCPTAPLGEAGGRGQRYGAVKRLATFASQFAAVFAELDPDYHPVTVALDHVAGEQGTHTRKPAGQGVAVVPLRGTAGRIVFVFGDPEANNQTTTLLLDHGLPLPIALGDQSVGWYLIDVDLGGVGRLDYANLCPFAFVDRSVLVLFGPERAVVNLSVDESLIETTVPTGEKPRVIAHHDITVVICSQKQIDATYIDDHRVYVGASGLDAGGAPIPAPGFGQLTIVSKDGVQTVKSEPVARPPGGTRLNSWRAAPAVPQSEGSDPRYASLGGPETLDACGTPAGYGWYRAVIKVAATRKRRCALPQAGNRLHLFLDGVLQGVIGTGPGSIGHQIDLPLTKGEHTLVGLVDHAGRFDGGNDFGRRKGWYGHLYEIAPLRAGRARVVDAAPLDPFTVRPFLLGQSTGRMTAERHAVWTFTHRKKSPLLLHVEGVETPGMFLINGAPLAWYAGAVGETNMRLLVVPREVDAFKRGANELRFAPDPEDPDAARKMADGLAIYECVDAITDGATWSFARWEVPPAARFQELSPTDLRKARGRPCWWRTTFIPRSTAIPLWFNTLGLSKGQVFFNGRNVGRYFTATRTGAKVGPQTKLYLPEPWAIADGENELIVFDEHGFSPQKTKIEYRQEGELE